MVVVVEAADGVMALNLQPRLSGALKGCIIISRMELCGSIHHHVTQVKSSSLVLWCLLKPSPALSP